MSGERVGVPLAHCGEVPDSYRLALLCAALVSCQEAVENRYAEADPALGLVVFEDGEARCTGALVSPRFVAIPRGCIGSPWLYRFHSLDNPDVALEFAPHQALIPTGSGIVLAQLAAPIDVEPVRLAEGDDAPLYATYVDESATSVVNTEVTFEGEQGTSLVLEHNDDLCSSGAAAWGAALFSQGASGPELSAVLSSKFCRVPLAAERIQLTRQTIDYVSGCDLQAEYVKSRAFAARPDGEVDTVVIHTAEGRYDTTLEFLGKQPASGVSAHYLQAASGELSCLVPEEWKAYQSGSVELDETSIGIEHEGWTHDGGAYFTEEMYRSSASLVRRIAERHGIGLSRDAIIGHYEVRGPKKSRSQSNCGGRSNHTDPGPSWNWDYFMALLSDPDAKIADHQEWAERPMVAADRLDVRYPSRLAAGQETEIVLHLQNVGRQTLDSNHIWLVSDSERSQFFLYGDWATHRSTRPETEVCLGPLRAGELRFPVLVAPLVQERVTEDFELRYYEPGGRVTTLGHLSVDIAIEQP